MLPEHIEGPASMPQLLGMRRAFSTVRLKPANTCGFVRMAQRHFNCVFTALSRLVQHSSDDFSPTLSAAAHRPKLASQTILAFGGGAIAPCPLTIVAAINNADRRRRVVVVVVWDIVNVKGYNFTKRKLIV